MSNGAYQISIHTLAHRASLVPAFKDGFSERMKGGEFRYDAYSLDGEQMYYERGRAFAIYTLVMKEKVSRWMKGKLGKAGQERIVRAFTYGFIR